MSICDTREFQRRHIGPRGEELKAMLAAIGVDSLDQLIDQTVPQGIRRQTALDLGTPLTEAAMLRRLRDIASKNRVIKSYIGQGYYGCYTPSVIARNVFENPGWYTQYTPYQPEISQGRLEALLNFQTMIGDLTGMEIANASLLDEGTAAAEAMAMAHGIANKGRTAPANRFFVSKTVFIQTLDVVKARALPLGIEVVVGDHASLTPDQTFFAALVQYPAEDGSVLEYRPFIQAVHAAGMIAIVATDLMSLALLTPPGAFGADIVVGNSQRFGVPMGFGGPHAAFFATKNEYIRQMPGRIIGVSVDARGNRAFRMTLQTREQHIRREKATSNICTAQALLAIMAGMYGVYHGPEGIRSIATRIHRYTVALADLLCSFGYKIATQNFFDTLAVETSAAQSVATIHADTVVAGYNLRHIDATHFGVALDETSTEDDVLVLAQIFAKNAGKAISPEAVTKAVDGSKASLPEPFGRKSAYLTHPIFSLHHSENDMMRYIKSLENKDLSMTHSMIPLGSCTMKLNAASELFAVSWPEFSSMHPFAPLDQAQGYVQVFAELESALCAITGFAGASLQPNSGAQGEYTGLLVIRAYYADHNQSYRNVVLIPSSARGTNPASAVMAGFKVVVVQCDGNGNIDLTDLQAKVSAHKDALAGLMVTYPSTHGVFEAAIKDICALIHANGGLVYMDGANMNAQVGLTSPAIIGADVCHINLHKTFAIPHGGGGPGVGPICVAENLVPYLPGHPVVKTGGTKAIHAVASAPWSSANVTLISYAYIAMMGGEGLTDATRYAILNANYLKAKLEPHFPVLYTGANGRVAHEFILSMKQFKAECGVDVEDISKRLMDYGFHAPTISFPVHDTLMIEPTESEPKAELDRFVDALIQIRKEMQAITDGVADRTDNVLKNAPHTASEALGDTWTHPYSRHEAIFPLPAVEQNKFWVPVARVNNTYGDKNIVCSCPPMESYESA